MGRIKNINNCYINTACRFITVVLVFILFLHPFLFHSCASPGSPTGGDYDTIPPVFLSSKPAPNSVNFRGNKIELLFDEYIKIDKPSEKVIITPPQSKMPVIRSQGKKIVIELKDTLVHNTTYTLDFTNAIIDNNEGNAIEGFTLAFSTGDAIDSLLISGILLNAENLEPMPNIMVGLHSNLEDSAFTTLPFMRTSMTNDRGQFWIRNIAQGTYRLFALKDQNRNFKYDQVTEEIAFYDELITPDFIADIRLDTLRIDSLTIDTIKEIHYNRFIPDDIVMFLFKEKKERQYLSKHERPMDRKLIFRFNSQDGLPPELNLLNRDQESELLTDWFVTEYSSDKTNIIYWIKDSLVYKQDTLFVEAKFLISDSLDVLVPKTDTLRFIWKAPSPPKKDNKKDNKKESEEKIEFLRIECNTRGTMDVFDTLKITFSEPLIDFDYDAIKIQQKVDTLWEDRKYPILQDTLNPRLFYIDRQWYYDQEFRIIIDSASIYSIYGLWNDSTGFKFKFQSEKEYGNIYINISGIEEEIAGFGELLDSSDKVLRKSILKNSELIFEDLKPGKFYLRFIEDTNGNGIWDTGNYEENIQPERVYYYNEVFTVTKYGSQEQDWDIRSLPFEKQKPLEITKNKPVVKQPKRTDPKDQNNRQNQGSSNPFGGGSIPGMGGRSVPRF